eukprot:snap_masked-scaffold2106_size20872-processed-gene-0.3 protein:Tk07425 transcript:snap_masked-scaffold2106_size20872-processed-gene-0.3-mRNA-1 annotation:"hypothetical protein RO3G_05736"
MAMDDEAFKAKYGFDKPEKSAHVVVHCLKGGRAAKAASTLKDMGYNVEPYSGSMEDWLAKKGPTDPILADERTSAPRLGLGHRAGLESGQPRSRLASSMKS